MPLGTPQVIPPPPDLQPIVDKLAIYVAKNGPDFESIIKAKNDPRFEFLNPWNTHHGYYNLKKQEALANQQLQQSATSEGKEHWYSCVKRYQSKGTCYSTPTVAAAASWTKVTNPITGK